MSAAEFAGPRSTAAKYSNAFDFDGASLPPIAQVGAQTCLHDLDAPVCNEGSGVRVCLSFTEITAA